MQSSNQNSIADQAFQALRKRSIVEKTEALKSLLSVAEKAAKITFNASYSRPPYDANSGWKLVLNARDYCECLKDKDFTDLVWKSIAEDHKQ